MKKNRLKISLSPASSSCGIFPLSFFERFLLSAFNGYEYKDRESMIQQTVFMPVWLMPVLKEV